MTQYVLSRAAAADLGDIWDHIAEDSIAAADRTQQELLKAISLLAMQPGAGSSRSYGPPALLFWPVSPYIVIYRRQQRSIEIVGVIHGARDIPAVLQGRL